MITFGQDDAWHTDRLVTTCSLASQISQGVCAIKDKFLVAGPIACKIMSLIVVCGVKLRLSLPRPQNVNQTATETTS